MAVTETKQTSQAYALILNTFEDLEGPVLSHICTRCSKVYSIGPLHLHLKFQLEAKVPPFQSQSFKSLFEVDMSCMTWLDAQPLKSVIYVSFGSITIMPKDELIEFWQEAIFMGHTDWLSGPKRWRGSSSNGAS